MIARIRGELVESNALSILVDCGGIGYEVFVPLTTAEQLPGMGSEVCLHTVAIYREDAQALYGFATRNEKRLFELLVHQVSGVGPKLALNIMSRLSTTLLVQAIRNEDATLLSKCPGIGKKTAERLIVELKDKVSVLDSPQSVALKESPSARGAAATGTAHQDAVAALMTLGFKLDAADKAVAKAIGKLGTDAQVEAIIREALG